MQSNDDLALPDRAQTLLKVLIERYLDDGAPVASKTLAQTPGVAVSPATVRNIMADLEARGFVQSPHTSAGKVPTVPGLRLFVDSLLSVQPLTAARVKALRTGLSPDLSANELVDSASRLVAQLTSMAGVVTLPRFEVAELRQIEFLPLSGDRVLVILVINDREVQNRVIHTTRDYSQAELNAAANYINANFAGNSLQHTREALHRSMQEDKDEMTDILQAAVDLAGPALEEEEAESDYRMTGEQNLLQPDPDLMQKMFEAFAEKGRILHLLDRCLDSDGVQLFIGEESGYRLLGDMSLIASSYEINGQVAGVLGVIGPTRMAYKDVIPIVDVTARLLGAAIEGER
ncbi:MAG: heat-inducible transcriptional repressor HrcA [Pseudomonadota bacterium]